MKHAISQCVIEYILTNSLDIFFYTLELKTELCAIYMFAYNCF